MNEQVIQIGGKSYKECDIVMLLTKEQRWKIGNEHDDRYEFYSFVDKKLYSRQSNAHNWSLSYLYILSSEEIKEGDWYYNSSSKTIHQSNGIEIFDYRKDKQVNWKIIASTNSELKEENVLCNDIPLPRLSNDFIKAFVKANGKGFEKVLVEYEYKGREYVDEQDGIGYDKVVLKVSPDNTITIKSVEEKTYWSREEVIQLAEKCLNHFKPMNAWDDEEALNFIKQNL